MESQAWTFYEFFAGGGMARAGLGPAWAPLFANDFDAKKCASYAVNWGQDSILCEDIANLTSRDVPGHADLAWASFPCQDLSLAGHYLGLSGARSGTFFPFHALIKDLAEANRKPRILVLENVCGTLSSHQGADFQAICQALSDLDYHYGAVVMDAARFLPQSRPRLFIIALADDLHWPESLTCETPDPVWHPPNLRKAYQNLPEPLKAAWQWWHLPLPEQQPVPLRDLIEDGPHLDWHSHEAHQRLIAMMSDRHRAKLSSAQALPGLQVGTLYKRTRKNADGIKQQRAEIRFDMAGCLRTPAGGSSRQTIFLVNGRQTRSRLMSPRETARLMGLPDSYQLPERANEAYHLIGDGLVVPVVAHLRHHLLEPILKANQQRPRIVA